MKVLDIARSQIGVTEWPSGSNNVKYNTWYYGQEVYDGLWGAKFPWCMAFVQWCFNQANLKLPFKTASCATLLSWYKSNAPKRVYTTPQPGDIVIYDGHTGIVESVQDCTHFIAIEGNTSVTSFANGGEVQRVNRTTAKVKAFIRPYDYDEEGDLIMDGKEIYLKLSQYLAQQPLPSWAKEEYQEAIDAGITDGSNPQMLIPRYQAALMCLRAYKKGKGE